METKIKNREWVKDAAIVFLVVLLVLTFFSNTIMNRTLPEVATAEVTSGSIVAKVRGSGTVTASGKHQVKAKEIRTIRSVMIKAGQEVNTGDVLFVLGEGDATELEQAKETLRNLQTSYQRTALSTPIYNYSAQERAIQNAHTAYDRAAAKLAEAQSKRDSTIKDPVTTAAKERYEKAAENAKKIETDYAEGDAKKKAALEEEIESIKEQMKAYEDAAAAQQEALEAAQNSLLEAELAAELADGDRQQAQEEYDAVELFPDATPEQKENARTRLSDAIDHYQNANANVQAAKTAVDAAQEALDSILGPEYANLKSSLVSKQSELDAIGDSAHYEEVRAAIKLRDQLYDEYAAMAGYVEEDYQTALYALQDADAALQAAYDNLYTAQENDARSAATAGVELSSIQEEIRLQQEKIKSLAGDEENVITANVSGTVDTVDCTAGDTVLKDALLCTIEVPDMGHTLSFSVTNDQAQRLRVGDTATISNYYWGNSITATLTSIRTDPKKAQTNKLLTFDLTGDVTTGAELTISVGQKSATYDLIVPNSAIKSDTNGRFVLAVTAKSSPLGNRYTARRVSVEVLANDDNNSAIVADLSSGDYVITTSSAPLNSGDMVRMADS